MGFRSKKHRAVSSISYSFSGGMDISVSPVNLPDGVSQALYNMGYLDGEQVPSTRPALRCVTSNAAPNPIDKVYWHASGSASWLAVAAAGTLYHLDGDVLASNAALAGSEYHEFLSFNDKLLIADGSASGAGYIVNATDTVVSRIATSPANPTCLREIGGRVAINSMADNEQDAVYISDVEDETAYTMNSIRAGFGDGLRVTALENFGTDLVVFKNGARQATYRVMTAGSSSQWYADQAPFTTTSTDRAGAVARTQNDIMFAAPDGVRSIKGVQEYGDLKVGGVGTPLDVQVANGGGVREMAFCNVTGQMFVVLNNSQNILVYHPHVGAWTEYNFGVQIRSITNAGDRVYLGASNGHIYELSTGATATDELTPGVETDFESYAKTRTTMADGEILIRKTTVFLDFLAAGTGQVRYYGADGITSIDVDAWTLDDATGLLADATGLLADAATDLGTVSSKYRIVRGRFRDQGVALLIRATSGRFKINNAVVEAAIVNG